MPAKIQRGCVLIARPILRSGLWTMPPADRVVAITAVVLANHEPAKWFDGRSQVQIGRGQFARSWRRLAREANVSVPKARVSVAHLLSCDFLRRQPCGRYSLYTVPKYPFYQDKRRYGSERDIPEGYVLLARKVMDSSLWALAAADRALAITCLLLAHHSREAAEWSDGDRHLSIGRGQFATTWDKLASAANLGPDETRSSMARLESAEFVVRSEAEGHPPVFTIPNYDFYQSLSNYVEGGGELGEQADPGPLVDEDAPPTAPTAVTDANNRDAGRRQDGDKTVTRGSQDGDNKQEGKKNDKNGEEGEGLPPAPELFQPEAWGASPPLPPEARIAKAYQDRYPGVMGWPKALHQAGLFLARGGRAEDALRAIASDARTRVVIWKILDPLVHAAGSVLNRWVPPEEREGGP